MMDGKIHELQREKERQAEADSDDSDVYYPEKGQAEEE